ncbi:unnamed protein product [Gordionus sp. m RMFG-2023]
MTPIPKVPCQSITDINDFVINNEVINEDIIPNTDGYELLNQESEEEEQPLPSHIEIPYVNDYIEDDIGNNLDFEFNLENEIQVKNAMLNINIPSSNFPQWSFQITEEEWNNKLYEIIQKRS